MIKTSVEDSGALEWSVRAGMQELGVDPDLPPNAYRCLPERLWRCMWAFGRWSDG